MKINLFLFVFVLFSASVYSQTKNNIAVYYGISNVDVDIHGAIGDFGYKPQSGTSFGLTYERTLGKVISMETGLQYYNDNVHETYIFITPGGIIPGNRYGQAKILSIPLNVKFNFLHYFYGTTGIAGNFQTNYNSNSAVDKQTGLGFEFGLGAKYAIGNINLFVNGYAHYFSLIHFSSNSNSSLLDDGLRFGVGYNF